MGKSPGHLVSAIYRHLQIHLNHELSHLDLGRGQFMFFNHISHQDGITQKELSRNLAIDKATTAKAVRKLTERGYIYAEQDKEDRRSYKLHLTEKGRETAPLVQRVLKETKQILVEGMTPPEIVQTERLLTILFTNITTHLQEKKNEK